MNKFITIIVLFLFFSLSSYAKVTTVSNPFEIQNNRSLDQHLKINKQKLSYCGNLPRTCKQMSSCKQAKQAFECGNFRLDRDKDGVPCEKLCK